MLRRSDKLVTIDRNGKREVLSIDRVKPAHLDVAPRDPPPSPAQNDPAPTPVAGTIPFSPLVDLGEPDAHDEPAWEPRRVSNIAVDLPESPWRSTPRDSPADAALRRVHAEVLDWSNTTIQEVPAFYVSEEAPAYPAPTTDDAEGEPTPGPSRSGSVPDRARGCLRPPRSASCPRRRVTFAEEPASHHFGNASSDD